MYDCSGRTFPDCFQLCPSLLGVDFSLTLSSIWALHNCPLLDLRYSLHVVCSTFLICIAFFFFWVRFGEVLLSGTQILNTNVDITSFVYLGRSLLYHGVTVTMNHFLRTLYMYPSLLGVV